MPFPEFSHHKVVLRSWHLLWGNYADWIPIVFSDIQLKEMTFRFVCRYMLVKIQIWKPPCKFDVNMSPKRPSIDLSINAVLSSGKACLDASIGPRNFLLNIIYLQLWRENWIFYQVHKKRNKLPKHSSYY